MAEVILEMPWLIFFNCSFFKFLGHGEYHKQCAGQNNNEHEQALLCQKWVVKFVCLALQIVLALHAGVYPFNWLGVSQVLHYDVPMWAAHFLATAFEIPYFSIAQVRCGNLAHWVLTTRLVE